MQTEIILKEFKNLLVFFFFFHERVYAVSDRIKQADRRAINGGISYFIKVCLRNTCDLITNLRIE